MPFFALFIIFSLLLAPGLYAQQPSLFIEERQAIVKDIDKFDWLRLSSGEWLKGEFKAMYDKQIEFDSDILDTLFIDREDVHMVISGKAHSVRFNDGSVYEGALLIGPDYVQVGEQRLAYMPKELVSIAASADNVGGAWYAKVGLGANLSRGNTEQTELSANVDIKRRTATNRLLINALAARTSNDEEVTENNVRANGTFDWFYTKALYFRPVFFDYYRDPFQNIDHKYTLGAGLGYYVVDTQRWEWDVGLGPAYQRTQFSNVGADAATSNSSTSVYFSSNMDYELTSDIDLNFDYRFTLAEQAAGGNAQHALAGASIDITSDIDFDISLLWDHLQSPIANADGTVPKKDDYKMIVTFAVEL
ncbi:DUF481 domain-containing protein [Pseudoalteromonas sp. T1lg75]|uniref:DUF481 domain-containing protein n=1 Tax=Pseudoalteromonas sp. T1lg75 TaxID=2077102 RepID=UPI000CF6F41B|nr:DUF481 domain-containing protein [Pseudoalteromonas sp. T1lg75]